MNSKSIGLLLLMLILAAVSVPALAVRLTSDADQQPERPMPPVPLPPPPPPPPERDFAFIRYIDRVTIQGPYADRGLSVFVLTTDRPDDPRDFLGLDEGLASGQLVVQELPEGNVQRLRIRNLSGRVAFLMAGELVVGGKQNRTIGQDVLLPPGGSAWVNVPVYCIERRRWTDGDKMESGGAAAPGELRQGLNQGYEQDRVWNEVRRMQEEQGIRSETDNMAQVYVDQKTSQLIDGMAHRIIEKMPVRDRCVGLVAAYGGRVVSADLFANPQLYRRLYEKVIRSHAAQICLRPPSDQPPSVREVRLFLDRVHGARCVALPAPNDYGQAIGVSGNGIGGRATELDGRCVHAALFPEIVIRPLPMEREDTR